MEFKDYYAVLGLAKSATDDEIKKTYRKLAKKHHPDANAGSKKSEEKFKELSEAYEVLGDKEKRAAYDDMVEDMKSGRYRSADGGFDPSAFRGGSQQYSWSSGADGAADFSDFFNMFFGGSQRGGFGYEDYPTEGRDVSATVTLGLKEAFKGGEQTITLQTALGAKTVKFKVPAGIQPGEKIKLKGLGGGATGGGRPGDLYLEIELRPEAGFVLNGTELEKTIDVYPWQAALGDEIEVATLDEKLKIKIPAGIQSGGKLRLAARGYPLKNGKRGALSLTVRIVNPVKLSDDMKKLYEQLRDQCVAVTR